MDNFFNDNDNDDDNDIEFKSITRGAITKFRKDLGKVNIIVAGKTGVGKSTLVNAIFNKELASTGVGKPVSQNITEYSIPEFPISIIDTKGLEIKDYKKIIDNLKNYIKKRGKNSDVHNRIHIAWVCISEEASRFEAADKELVKMLSEYMSVIIILTKTFIDQGFDKVIQKL